SLSTCRRSAAMRLEEASRLLSISVTNSAGGRTGMFESIDVIGRRVMGVPDPDATADQFAEITVIIRHRQRIGIEVEQFQCQGQVRLISPRRHVFLFGTTKRLPFFQNLPRSQRSGKEDHAAIVL